MHRLFFLLCTLSLLSACGPKRVQVQLPAGGTSTISASELEGNASYYAEPYHGRRTASGEIFDTYQDLTAAHRTLPFNTVVRVENKRNGREVVVRINDRGPFIDGRVIDLSLRAAREIDMVRAGVVPVSLTILTPSASSGAMYAVQVASFENPDAAEDLKQKLGSKYPAARVEPFSGEKTMYRVRIGREPDLQAAQKLAAQLRAEDLEPFIVRVN